MADLVTNTVLNDGHRNVVVLCVSESDGTGESNAIKIDLSTLSAGRDGKLPTRLTVDWIQYDVTGYNYVLLEYDHATDAPIALLKGSGTFVFPGGKADILTTSTGDVILTTDGNADGNGYTITIGARKKYD